MAQDTFAFGESDHNGKACPVVAATGEKPREKALTIAEQYDTVVLDWYGIHEGTLPESVAELCWKEAIRRTRESAKNFEGRDNEHAEYLRDAVREGEAIASVVF